MVQVLPYVPSFLEQLNPHINQIAGGIGAGIGKHFQNKKDQTILEQLKNGGNSAGVSYEAWGQLSPAARELYQPFLDSQLRTQENETKLRQKEDFANREKVATREELIPAAKAIEGLIDKSAYGAGSAKDMAELDTSGFWYTDKVYTHFNKGVVSNTRFETMKNDLAPNSRLRPSVNKARLAALNRVAGLPANISSDKFDKVLDKELKTVKAVQDKEDKIAAKSTSDEKKGIALTDEVAAQLFAEAGNDPEKARKLAKERGYAF